MTIKSHIAISATISLALIALIACQQKPQAPKEENNLNDKIKTQRTKFEGTVREAQEGISKAESEAIGVNTNKIIESLISKEKSGDKNLFVNSDFSDGLNGWSHDKNVNIVEIDGQSCVECIGPSKGQTRIWQTINTTSGHVYRLSFNVKAENKGAFAIFRDDNNNKEKYLFADVSEEWKEYQKDFKSIKNGNYRVFLSCQNEGKYYYKDASLIDITDTKTEQ